MSRFFLRFSTILALFPSLWERSMCSNYYWYHSILHSLKWFKCLSIFLLPFTFILRSSRMAKSTRRHVRLFLLINTWFGILRDLVISLYPREFLEYIEHVPFFMRGNIVSFFLLFSTSTDLLCVFVILQHTILQIVVSI